MRVIISTNIYNSNPFDSHQDFILLTNVRIFSLAVVRSLYHSELFVRKVKIESVNKGTVSLNKNEFTLFCVCKSRISKQCFTFHLKSFFLRDFSSQIYNIYKWPLNMNLK